MSVLEAQTKEQEERIKFLTNTQGKGNNVHTIAGDGDISMSSGKHEHSEAKHRREKAKGFTFCEWPWISESNRTLAVTKLPEDYDPNSHFLRLKSKPPEAQLREARLYGLIWEVENNYMHVEVAKEQHYHDVCKFCISLNSTSVNWTHSL